MLSISTISEKKCYLLSFTITPKEETFVLLKKFKYTHTMKAFRFFLLAILVMAIPAPKGAAHFLFTDGDTPILIRPLPTEFEEEPRGPVFNPFSAFLEGEQVTLESAVSCGLVTVKLTSTAGDNYTTEFDTERGEIIIPTSGMAGDYTLLLTTQSGTIYYGCFIL